MNVKPQCKRPLLVMLAAMLFACADADEESLESEHVAPTGTALDMREISEDSLARLAIVPDSRSRLWQPAQVDTQLNVLIAAIDPRRAPASAIDSLTDYRNHWRWDDGGVEKLGRTSARLFGVDVSRMEQRSVRTVRDSRALLRTKLSESSRMANNE